MLPNNKLPQYGDDGELLLVKFCTNCGNVNNPDAEYCADCGASFSTLPMQQSDQVVPDLNRTKFYWFPYRKFSLLTPGSVEDATSRLAQAIIKRRGRSSPYWGSNLGKFEGNVSVKGFNLNRITRFHGLSLPFVYGSFRRVRSRTRVTVKMTLHPFHWVMTVHWCLLLSLTMVNLLSDRSYGFIVILGLFLFTNLLTLIGFNSEARKAQAFMEDVFRTPKSKT